MVLAYVVRTQIRNLGLGLLDVRRQIVDFFIKSQVGRRQITVHGAEQRFDDARDIIQTDLVAPLGAKRFDPLVKVVANTRLLLHGKSPAGGKTNRAKLDQNSPRTLISFAFKVAALNGLTI